MPAELLDHVGSLLLRQQRRGRLRHRSGHRRRGRGRRFPQPRGSVAAHLRHRERLARSLRRHPLPRQGRQLADPLLPGDRRDPRPGCDRIQLTLATCIGKTSIAFQIIWKLFQARWNLPGQPTHRPRILFLADRNNLADQALNDFTAFAAFEENALARLELDALRKKGRVPTIASVFLTIFARGTECPSPHIDDRATHNSRASLSVTCALPI